MLPAHCAACEGPAPPERRIPLCEACGGHLAAILAAEYCPRCGRGAGPYVADETGCDQCRARRPAYDGAVRAGAYRGPLARLVLAYKYGRQRELGPVLGRLLAERATLAGWAEALDFVVPVPLHWRRRVARGFNQAAGLAREMEGRFPRAKGVGKLLRVRPTAHQTRLPPSRRAANVRGAFEVRGAAEIEGRRVLVVDDVMTSGSTVSECARTLKRGGAAAVYVAVVAVAGRDEPGPW